MFGDQYAMPLIFNHRGDSYFTTTPWQVASIISYIGFLVFVMLEIISFNSVTGVEVEEVFKGYLTNNESVR